MKLFLVGILYVCVQGVFAAPKIVQVGGLFHGPNSQAEIVFRYAIQKINSDRSFQIVELSERVKESDNLEVFLTVCDKLLPQGVWAVFGPLSSNIAGHVQSICDVKEIPHIETRFDANQRRQDILVNLYPHPKGLAKVFVELVEAWKWTSFTIIYEDDDGLARISELLKMTQKEGHNILIRKLYGYPDFRPLFRKIKRSGERNFVLDCSYDILGDILKQALQVGLLIEENSFIITQLDLQNLDLEAYQYGGANITGVRLVDLDNPFVKDTIDEWATFNKNGYYEDIQATDLLAESAMLHDAVNLFARTVQRMFSSRVNATAISCDYKDNWIHGFTLVNLMKDNHNAYRGLTGPVFFDNEGFRSNFLLDIMELSTDGLIKIGNWNSSDGLRLHRHHTWSESHLPDVIANKTLRVLIAFSLPYGMRKNRTDNLVGNDRYEGFGVDIIHELSLLLGFNYTFEIQHDSKYGSYDKVKKEWNGMIRRLQDEEADLAITDLTITAERQTGADFTTPFMNLGISILYRKPTKATPKLFSFMDPFSLGVWIVMFLGYIGVSLIIYLMARISPYEWTNPYPCIEEPETLENQFTLRNSLWFTIGSLMQQGSELAPIAVSTRLIAGIWWFFTLIIISSYTANLAAFLTVESLTIPFKEAEDLVDQTEIKYGAKRSGSTLNYFRDSDNPIFQRMYQYMTTTEGVLTVDNDEGLAKVKNENYAFFMESASIDYFVERNCDVQQYGGLLDNKGYGIAMRKEYPYRNELNGALLQLLETGKIQKLRDKWWREERGGGQCLNTETGSGIDSLELENVGGVFVVLVSGVGMAVFIAVLELLYTVAKTSHREKVPFLQELMEELKFIIKLHGSTKPVRKYNQEPEAEPEETVDNDIPVNPYTYGFITNSKEPLK